MNNRDIEKMLMSKKDDFAPNDFDTIKNIPVVREDSIERAIKDSAKKSKKRIVLWKRVLPVALSLIIIVTLSFILSFQSSNPLTAYAEVYIDINPSIGLKVNENDKVIDVNYYNDEAKELINKDNLIGNLIDVAVNDIVDAACEKKYIEKDKDNFVSVASFCNEEKYNEELKNKLDVKLVSNMEQKRIKCDFNYKKVTNIQKEVANRKNLSPGKYAQVQEILKNGSEYTEEELCNMPMKIIAKIRNKSNTKHNNNPQNENSNQNSHFSEKPNNNSNNNDESNKTIKPGKEDASNMKPHNEGQNHMSIEDNPESEKQHIDEQNSEIEKPVQSNNGLCHKSQKDIQNSNK